MLAQSHTASNWQSQAANTGHRALSLPAVLCLQLPPSDLLYSQVQVPQQSGAPLKAEADRFSLHLGFRADTWSIFADWMRDAAQPDLETPGRFLGAGIRVLSPRRALSSAARWGWADGPRGKETPHSLTEECYSVPALRGLRSDHRTRPTSRSPASHSLPKSTWHLATHLPGCASA